MFVTLFAVQHYDILWEQIQDLHHVFFILLEIDLLNVVQFQLFVNQVAKNAVEAMNTNHCK